MLILIQNDLLKRDYFLNLNAPFDLTQIKLFELNTLIQKFVYE